MLKFKISLLKFIKVFEQKEKEYHGKYVKFLNEKKFSNFLSNVQGTGSTGKGRRMRSLQFFSYVFELSNGDEYISIHNNLIGNSEIVEELKLYGEYQKEAFENNILIPDYVYFLLKGDDVDVDVDDVDDKKEEEIKYGIPCFVDKIIFLFKKRKHTLSMRRHVFKYGGFSEYKSRIIFKKLLKPLKFLHSINIGHNDLKIGNYLIVTDEKYSKSIEDCEFLLIDFESISKKNCESHEERVFSPSYAPRRRGKIRYWTSEKKDIFGLGQSLCFFTTMSFLDDERVRAILEDKKEDVKRIYPLGWLSDELIDFLLKLSFVKKGIDNVNDILNHKWMKMEIKQKDCSFNEVKSLKFTQLIPYVTNKKNYKKVFIENKGNGEMKRLLYQRIDSRITWFTILDMLLYLNYERIVKMEKANFVLMIFNLSVILLLCLYFLFLF